jgi:putative cardiolipin synthase
MIDDGHDTELGRQFGGRVTDHPGKAGVFLLQRGRDAFAARALLARLAEKSLDIQL